MPHSSDDPKRMDGLRAREAVLARVREAALDLSDRTGIVPGLATVLVGDHPASHSYVSLKRRTAESLGFRAPLHALPDTVSQAELVTLVGRLSADPAIHGILVQLPLPVHIDERAVIAAIAPRKDVDGFHPENLGRLFRDAADCPFPPCTPAGVLELLRFYDVDTRGVDTVVVGRSNLVGKPLALMMAQRWPSPPFAAGVNGGRARTGDAAVTLLHSHVPRDRVEAHVRRADIVVCAAGRPGLIPGDWIRPDAVVVDVGVNRVGQTPEGKAILRGDCDYATARERARLITPVPGGVGPMTVALLMRNVLRAAMSAAGRDWRVV